MSWDLHLAWIVAMGAALLAMTVLPRVLHERPLSLPIVYVAAGFMLFEFSDEFVGPRPMVFVRDATLVEIGTELIVIISLLSAGLRIDRRIGLVRWHTVWRLLGVTMLVSIGVTALLGWWFAGLTLAGAVLVGAVLAPTDPVIADEVQVGPPGEDGDADEVRFTLTAEAGLNDGLAFPFVHLAMALTTASLASAVGSWVAYDLAYRVLVGAAAGWALGRLLNAFGRRSGEFFRSETSEGLFALGATLLVYGLTEVVNGYGFLAVFIAGLVRGGGALEYRRKAHAFTEQIESVLFALMLIGFGALLSEGVLDALTWPGAIVAASLLIVTRPLAGWAALAGSGLPSAERWTIAFFGIRGIGSIYYLAYAANHAEFGADVIAEVWAIVAFNVLCSIALHGITAAPWLRRVGVLPPADDEAAEPEPAPSST